MTEVLWQSIYSYSDRRDLKAVMGAFNRDDGGGIVRGGGSI